MDYALVTKLGEQDAAYQAAVFRGCIGAKGLGIYDGLPFKDDTDKDDVKRVLGLLEKYYVGKLNVTYERYKFHSRDQLEEDGTMANIGELRRLAHTCEFGRLTPDQLYYP